MTDALTASALLMAILAILFSVWSGDIAKVLDASFALALANRGPQRRAVIFTLFAKATPLTLASWASFLVFARRAWGILGTLIPMTVPRDFDDVSAAFVVSELLVLAIAVSASVQLAQLAGKWSDSYAP